MLIKRNCNQWMGQGWVGIVVAHKIWDLIYSKDVFSIHSLSLFRFDSCRIIAVVLTTRAFPKFRRCFHFIPNPCPMPKLMRREIGINIFYRYLNENQTENELRRNLPSKILYHVPFKFLTHNPVLVLVTYNMFTKVYPQLLPSSIKDPFSLFLQGFF